MTKKNLKLKPAKSFKFNAIIAPFKDQNNQKIFAAVLILTSLYLLIAFVSFFFQWQSDDSLVSGKDLSDIITDNKINNSIGGLGAYIANLFVKLWFGLAAFFIPLFSLLAGLKILGLKKYSLSSFIFNGILGMLIIPIFIRHFFGGTITAGGIGIYTNELMSSAIGNLGTSLLLITISIVYIAISFDIDTDKIKAFIAKIKPNKRAVKQENIEPVLRTTFGENPTSPVMVEKPLETLTETEHIPLSAEPTLVTQTVEEKAETTASEEGLGLEVTETRDEETLSETEIEKKLKELGDFDPTLELSQFKMPGMDLLNDYGASKIEIDKDELENNKNRIVETLGHYKIGIASISATVGPTITLYEIIPEAGIRISKIKNLEDDIALSLAAEGIRIIAPIPGRGTIGIEVPNAKKNTVSMLEVLKSEKFQNCKMELPIAFGKTISNETFVMDLAKMPHLLMAGATGQGKSVGLNAILASLLYKKHPSQVKFVLVDPKKVELTLFNKIERHYLAKLPDDGDAIITDTKKVVNTVNSLCIEMDDRYELCKQAKCRNIKEYNAKFISRRLNPNEGHRYLPYIVLVIDEFADLIMTAGKEIETPIARLAQLARAIGIHLIVATQRPSVNVITGMIKANFPARVAFKVTSAIDSRTIMDSKGAEQLIGMGDMLISTGSDLTRLQCSFIDTPEVEKICEFIGSQRAYPQPYMLPEYEAEAEAVGGKADLEDKDAMFDEAALVLVQHQSGSTSLIQRKLRLGYNRAGRIIDQLEAAGIVGPFEGSKARKVLVRDEMELEELLIKLNNND
ncbi:MAG: DNA translocase FtsK 4TM domain-containing protein [Cryomorphaceae bacterium]|nr:DNA translocase FtsK 4TM domain-containing protein [Cryomorphaceae bacterium]